MNLQSRCMQLYRLRMYHAYVPCIYTYSKCMIINLFYMCTQMCACSYIPIHMCRNICDWIWQKLASTHTMAGHTFHHCLTALPNVQLSMPVSVLKFYQSAFTVACFTGLPDVLGCSGGHQKVLADLNRKPWPSS